MTTTFSWIRERLIEAGTQGVSPADLYKQMRVEGIKRRRGTYQSFYRYFAMLVKLEWVIKTDRTEPSYQRGVETPGVLAEKVFYRISDAGRRSLPSDWESPQKLLYPEYAEPERWRKWYVPSERPRGRPPRKPKRVERELPITIPRPERVPRERRYIRLPVSVVIKNRLAELRPRVEALREMPNLEEIGELADQMRRLAGMAMDAQESARGEELEVLRELDTRLDRCNEGFRDLERGMELGNRVMYLRGLERVLGCFK